MTSTILSLQLSCREGREKHVDEGSIHIANSVDLCYKKLSVWQGKCISTGKSLQSFV